MNNDKKSKRTKDIEDRIADLKEDRAIILQNMNEISDAIDRAEDDLAIIPLKRFFFIRDIKSAEGYHRSFVEAETLEEAKGKLADDYSCAVLDDEDITVELDVVNHWEDDEK